MINGLMDAARGVGTSCAPIRNLCGCLYCRLAFGACPTFRGADDVPIRAVNSHQPYTDWTIDNVHSGALGWKWHESPFGGTLIS